VTPQASLSLYRFYVKKWDAYISVTDIVKELRGGRVPVEDRVLAAAVKLFNRSG
jgi:hypothetical protein